MFVEMGGSRSSWIGADILGARGIGAYLKMTFENEIIAVIYFVEE
jgi:hypothetical protein